MTSLTAIILFLLVAKWLAQLGLERLNRRHVLAHAQAVPEVFRGVMDEATYARSVSYTLAKSRLAQVEITLDFIVLLIVLGSGVLPWSYQAWTAQFGLSVWSLASWLFVIGLAMTLPGWPLDWYHQFHLEQQYGFNTMTPRLWWLDRFKALALGFLIAWPLMALILKLVAWTGPWWWLWAWGCVTAFQLILMVLAPVVILPLFNRFTPLAEGSLRDRLMALARRTGFRVGSIQIMDGSKRSRHANAFFTGFGRFRKIALFDTLINQLSEPELEAVLAHEIGHYKKHHIPKSLVVTTLSALVGFGALGWLANQGWFYQAFGFEPGHLAPALLLFALLSGTVTFWLAPLANKWSRAHEYQADAFAANAVREPHALIRALRRLNEKSLSNLTPHPIYSTFFYSHPTLLERELALSNQERISPPIQDYHRL